MKRTRVLVPVLLGLVGALVIGACANPSQPAKSSPAKCSVSVRVAVGPGGNAKYLSDSSVKYIHIAAFNAAGAQADSTDLIYNSVGGYFSGTLEIPTGSYLFEAFAYTAEIGGTLLYVGRSTHAVASDLTGSSALTIGVNSVILAGGSVQGSTPGTATAVAFCNCGSGNYLPLNLATDGQNIYATASHNVSVVKDHVLKIDMCTGSYESIYSTTYGNLKGITCGGGAIYVVNGTSIVKIAYDIGSSSWISTTVGLGSTSLGFPDGITYASNYLYVTDDSNNTIYKINPSNSALNSSMSFAAGLSLYAIRIGTDGTNLFVTTYGDTVDVWKITGFSSAAVQGWTISQPMGILVTVPYVYTTDVSDGCVYRAIPPGSPSAVSTSIDQPYGICTNGLNLYVSDQLTNRIYILEPST